MNDELFVDAASRRVNERPTASLRSGEATRRDAASTVTRYKTRTPLYFLHLLSIFFALFIPFLALAEPTVTIDRVQPRYPWSGVVDIDYTVSGLTDAEYATDYRLALTVSGTTNSTAFSISATNFVGVAWCDLPVTNGTHRVAWDSKTDGANFVCSATTFKFDVVYDPVTEKDANYLVVDLSAGYAAAARYPVRYVRAPNAPASLFNHALYKQSKVFMKKLPAATFRMGKCNTKTGTQGSADTQWHTVQLTKDFFLAPFHLTIAQYSRLMSASWSSDKTPKIISRNSIVASSGPLSNLCAKAQWHDAAVEGFTLPTEAQWEYACRAGAQTLTFWGSDKSDVRDNSAPYQWDAGNSGGVRHEVGTKKPNPWGFYDMTGNVTSWCLDRDGYYYQDPQYVTNGITVDPVGQPITVDCYYVYRGGSYKSAHWGSTACGTRRPINGNWAKGNYLSMNQELGFTSEARGDLGLRLAKTVSTTAGDSLAAVVKSSASKTVSVDLRTGAVRKLLNKSELLPIAYNGLESWSAGGSADAAVTVTAYKMLGTDPTDPMSWTTNTATELFVHSREGTEAWEPARRALWHLAMTSNGTGATLGTADFDLLDTEGVPDATPISETTITVPATVPFTGSAVLPTGVTVTYQGQTLQIGQDYELVGSDNLHIGTATLTIVGLNDFGGLTTRPFQIVSASAASVAADDATVALDARTNAVLVVHTVQNLFPFAWNTSETFATNPPLAWLAEGLPAASNAVAKITLSPMAAADAEPVESLAKTLVPAEGEGTVKIRGGRKGYYEARLNIETNGVAKAGALRRVLYFEAIKGLMIFVK